MDPNTDSQVIEGNTPPPPEEEKLYLRYLIFSHEKQMLFWLHRPISEFKDGIQTAMHNCNAWNGKCAGMPAFYTLSGHGYRHGRFNGKNYYLHRVTWEFFNGPIPDGMDVDHIDGNGTNNNLENLRIVSRSLNLRNAKKKSNNTSGFSGVTLDKRSNRWQARSYSSEGVCKSLGHFLNKEEAICVIERFRSDNPQYGFTVRHGK